MAAAQPPAAALSGATTRANVQLRGPNTGDATNQTAPARRTEEPVAIDAGARADDLIAAHRQIAALVPPLWPAEAALVDAPLVVLDAAQYRRATALGLAGRVGSLQFDAVIFGSDGRFRLARTSDDQHGAEVAFVFPAFDKFDVPSEVVAWVPETGRVAMLFGITGTLGIEALGAPWERPPRLYENLIEWWLADELGVFILDDRLSAADLEGEEIAVASREAGLRLRVRLARFTKKPPKIYADVERAVA